MLILRGENEQRVREFLQNEEADSIVELQKEHNERVQELEDRLDDQRYAFDRKIEKLQRAEQKNQDSQDDRFEDLKRENKRLLDAKGRENETERETLRAKVSDLEAKLKTAQELNKKASDLGVRELELEGREKALTVREKRAAAEEVSAEAEAKRQLKKIADAKDGEYKRGYADGVSDGVRKINEITKDSHDQVFKLAEKALAKETTVVTPVFAPAAAAQKQGK